MKLRKEKTNGFFKFIAFVSDNFLCLDRGTQGTRDSKLCAVCREPTIEILRSQDLLMNLIPVCFFFSFS